jgi:hypothetical protein
MIVDCNRATGNFHRAPFFQTVILIDCFHHSHVSRKKLISNGKQYLTAHITTAHITVDISVFIR